MIRQNPFDGKSTYTKFIWIIYKQLMKREWVCFSNVMVEYLKLSCTKELPYSNTRCPGYGELKKAFPDLIKLLQVKAGKDCIITRGNNRKKEFLYVGNEDNPLEDYQNASAIRDIKTYAQFCQDSAGFSLVHG